MTATLTFAETVAPTAATKGWHPDPRGRHHLRYHDGAGWTGHVTHFGPAPCHGCNAGPASAGRPDPSALVGRRS